MKKAIFKTSIYSILLLILYLSVGCKKNVDFRNEYTGNYKFTVHEHFVIPTDSSIFDTIIYYSGQIVKSSSGPNIIEIKYLPNSSTLAVVFEDGLIAETTNGPNGIVIFGKFEYENKISFDLVYGDTGSDHVEGIKN